MAKKAIIQDAGRYRPIVADENLVDGDGHILNHPQEGEMFEYNNSDPLIVTIDGLLYGVPGLVAGASLNGFTGVNSSTGAITVFADGTGGKVVVTSAGHNLQNGYTVTIDGTTSYNGRFVIDEVTTDTFEITDTWVANDATGDFWSGSKLIYDAGNNTQTFHVHSAISALAASTGHTFFWALELNGVVQTNIVNERKHANTDIGAISLTGRLVNLQATDLIELVTKNVGNTGNVTIKHCNVNLLI